MEKDPYVFANGVFRGCESLQTITIPSNVSEIGCLTFCDCPSLESIILPLNLTTIGDYAFYGCSGLKSMVIPPNVNKIGKYTFNGSYLENIKIGDGMTKVPEYAFYGCNTLKNVDLPHSIASIGDYAFYGCNTLKNIVLPNSIASIGDYTFRRCYSLTSINIPSSLTSVCDSTFEETLTALNIKTSKCLRFMPQLKSQIIEITFSKDYEETDVTHWDEWTKLEYLTSLSETPPMIGDSFSRFQKWNLRVMVPTSALETYKNTPVWKDFFFLKGGAETTDIENIKQDTNDANITGNHSTYNLNGMKVFNTKPGHIYIRGGKKYVAK